MVEKDQNFLSNRPLQDISRSIQPTAVFPVSYVICVALLSPHSYTHIGTIAIILTLRFRWDAFVN